MVDFVFDWKLIVGSIGSLFFAVLCAGSGIGGGCFYLVIFVLILQMDPHEAIPLSKITTFGVACGGFLILWMKRHPTLKYKPLISYPTALMVEPLTIYGTMLGVILNIISPSWVIIIVLVVLLGFTSYKTFMKAIKQWKGESQQIQEEREKASSEKPTLDGIPKDDINDDMKPSGDNGEAIIVDKKVTEEEDDVQGNGLIPLPQDDSETAQEDVKKREQRSLLKREILKALISIVILFVVWAVMFSIVLIKGGDKVESVLNIQCGSWLYWVMTSIGFPITLGVTIVVGAFLRWRSGGVSEDGDVQWNIKNCFIIPIGALFAGVSAAYLGIGGGMVIGPILLEIGVLPQVATATSAFMIMFTASSSSLQYIINGKLDLYYGLWYFAIGFFGAAFGQFVFSKVVQMFRRQSLIGFFLGVLIVLSTLAMVAVTVMQLVQDIKDDNLGFRPLCKATPPAPTNSTNATLLNEYNYY